MVTYVLDASAVLRFLDGEAGVDRVLACDSTEHILVTADFDAKPAERRVKIEFLSTKVQP